MLVSVGGPPSGKALTTDDATWRDAFEFVFLGAVRLVRDPAPVVTDGSAIVLLLAISAKGASPVFPISNGLRPGLAMLVKSFADELGPRNIRVNALLPNLFATDRVETALGERPAPIDGVSLRRIGDPAELGRMATVLLSPVASYVTSAANLHRRWAGEVALMAEPGGGAGQAEEVSMKAAVVVGAGRAPIFASFPEPQAEPGECRITVAASALSHLARGRATGKHYSAGRGVPFVPGVDGVGRLDDGRRVAFLLPRASYGGMAEMTVVPEARCMPVPDALSDVIAASLINAGMSSFAALTERAMLKPGETVLANGATGAAGPTLS